VSIHHTATEHGGLKSANGSGQGTEVSIVGRHKGTSMTVILGTGEKACRWSRGGNLGATMKEERLDPEGKKKGIVK